MTPEREAALLRELMPEKADALLPAPAAARPAWREGMIRKRHSHRCPRCREASYCYRKNCTEPQRSSARCWSCKP